MKYFAVLAALIAAPAAEAQTVWDQPAQTFGSGSSWNTQATQPPLPLYQPAPAPTYQAPEPALPLYSPQPYYPKQETFGDSRPYRESNPTTCTGLLCN